MDWRVLIIAAVVAAAVVAAAYLADRRSAADRRQSLATPPDRPQLAGEPVPVYLTADTVRAAPPRRAPPTPAERAGIDARLAGVTPLEVGWPSADFVTDPESRRTVLVSPLVVVTESVNRVSDLVPLLRRVQAEGRPLVIAAQAIAPEAMATLSLNVFSGRLSALCLLTDALAGLADAAGGRVIPSADLTAGFLPDNALGTCALWVTDSERTWVVPS
ncbi:MAG: hypothetical protein LBI33_02030 [Propionibacteriaceae bacterium]|nr:hypothetical protein [Propionibacteriaceae bacterium]